MVVVVAVVGDKVVVVVFAKVVVKLVVDDVMAVLAVMLEVILAVRCALLILVVAEVLWSILVNFILVAVVVCDSDNVFVAMVAKVVVVVGAVDVNNVVTLTGEWSARDVLLDALMELETKAIDWEDFDGRKERRIFCTREDIWS